MFELTEEQKRGLEEFEKEFKARIERVKLMRPESEAKRKAREYVEERVKRLEYVKQWNQK